MSVTQENERILITASDGRFTIFVGRGDTHLFQIVEDSTHPALEVTLRRRGGAIIKTVDTATLTMIKEKTNEKVIAAVAMTVDDVTAGELSFTFTAVQTAKPGTYLARITITHLTSGNVEPIPELVEVEVTEAL